MNNDINSKVILSTPGVSLFDIGDEVALIELHTQMNTLDEEVLSSIDQVLDRIEKDFVGLVVGSEGSDFCTGLDYGLILKEARLQDWDALGQLVKKSQRLNMRLRYFPRPVVIALAGKALRGGCAMAMHGSRVVAAAETGMGLDEFKYGLLPTGGGTKELMRRIINPAMLLPGADSLPYLKRVFDLIGQARISTGADEACKMGFLGPADRIVMHRSQVISEARREVSYLAASNFQPPTPELIYAAGQDARAVLRVNAWMLKEGRYISPYDFLVADKLAAILAGGDLSRPTWVSEGYILDLEYEAFLSLCGEEKTQARLDNLLQSGKPLRN